jgi:DNA-binding response OmpR family regulator
MTDLSSAASRSPATATAGWRVLVAHQHPGEAGEVAGVLRRHGHDVRAVYTGGAVLRELGDTDLVLLDVDLPDVDGIEVCRRIRAGGDTAIIAVSERANQLHRVLTLNAGADYYLVKPYGFRELVALIAAVMRRMRPGPTATDIVVHGPLRVDAVSRTVTVDDRPVELTRKEFELLCLLVSQADVVVPRKQIMEQVWGDTWSRRTLDTHVSSLRGKLSNREWIVTVRGVGFRFARPAAHTTARAQPPRR